MKSLLLFIFSFLTIQVLSQSPRLLLPIGHSGSINWADYSPSGRFIISGADDKSCKIWDPVSGMLLMDINGHSKPVNWTRYSLDEKYIFCGTGDETSNEVMVWEAATGKFVQRFPDDYQVAFSPDKKIMAITSGMILRIRKIGEDWPILQEYQKTLLETVTQMSFSKDGKRLLISDNRFNFNSLLLDLETKKTLATFRGSQAVFSPNEKYIATSVSSDSSFLYSPDGQLVSIIHGSSPSFSPDGNFIFSFSTDGLINSFNVRTGITSSLENNALEGNGEFAFSPDSKYMAAFHHETAQVWELKTGKVVNTVKYPDYHFIQTFVFSPDNRSFCLATGAEIEVRSLQTKKIQSELKGHTSQVMSVAFSPNGKELLTATGDKFARKWDLRTGDVKTRFVGHEDYLRAAAYNTEGNYVITASADKRAGIWKSNGELVSFIEGPGGLGGMVADAKFSPDEKLIVLVTGNGKIQVWDAKDKILLRQMDDPFNPIYQSISFDPTGKYIITTDYGSEIRCWNLADGKLLWKHKILARFTGNAMYSYDGKLVAGANVDNSVQVLDAVTGKRITRYNGPTDVVMAVGFSHDNKFLVAGSADNSVRTWEVATGIPVHKFFGHTNAVRSVNFSPDDKMLATASADNTVKLWDLQTARLVSSLISVDENDYLVLLPGGYYKSSRDAARLLHYVNASMQIISFDQLDLKFNRPDKVLEALGSTDTLLIKSYRNAWEKRIKKLKIDTLQFRESFNVPRADFINRETIGFEQQKEELKLTVHASDTIFRLERFNIWINDVPLFGQKGIDLKNKGRNNFDTTLIIKLSEEENKIETTVFNSTGVESFRVPLYVKYVAPVKHKQKLFFVGIGIDKFADQQHNLEYSCKDIRDLVKKFKAIYGENFVADTLFNSQVNLANIRALRNRLKASGVNDKVILAYSGHGLLSSDFDYYLSTYNVSFSKPEKGGLPYEELENLLDGIPARKKLLLIDACHSGEVDKEELITLNAVSASLDLKKGLKPVGYKNEQTVGLQNSFELMQDLFVNVSKATGATVISAAAGTQFALERNDLKNGVFTYSILEAMNENRSMKVSELKKYVSSRVFLLTNGLQQPTSRNENMAVDWEVW